MDQVSDVLVVGGGINGVSLAFHLAQKGASVTLLEKSFIAGGPTGYSSAIVRQHYSNPVTARMALESLRFWQNFREITGGDAGFARVGFFVGVGEADIEGLKANVALQQSVGINTRFVPVEEINAIEPHVSLIGLGGAAYEPESGYCDPASAANGLAQAAQRLGARIHSGVRVTGFQVQGDRVTGVETEQGPFSAGQVVVAAGPWTHLLLKPLGLNLPITVARVKVGFYRRPPELDRHAIWGDFTTQIYLRPERGNLMLVGSISPDEANDQVEQPDHFNPKVDLDILADFAERAARRFPLMEKGHLVNSYAALYDITPDWHAVLDAVPGYQGLYVCAGGSGHGFKLAPATGRMMAELVLEGKRPADDISLFAWDRFERGALVRGQYAYSILG
jgi:glycine/D-amino acid oxidase-like deaminating enzyme